LGKRKVRTPELVDMGINPFNDRDFVITTNVARTRDKFVTDGGFLIPSYYDMENEHIVKVYTSVANRKIIALLSANSLRLFMWIIYEVKYGRDLIWINKKRYMEEAQISSRTTYARSVAELTRYELIKLSNEKEVYWINPRYFFKGSRLKKYSNKIKR